MQLSKGSKKRIILSVIMVILAGIYNLLPNYPLPLISVPTMIYLMLDFNWGIYLYKRITQKSLLIPLMNMAVLIAFWFLLQQSKYHIFYSESTISRYLWYFYYVPMLFITLMGYFAARSIGKIEKDSFFCVLFIPTALIAMGILTNDFHYQAFSFNSGYVNWGNDYHHKWLYFVAVIWIIILMAATTNTVLRKNKRIENNSYYWVLTLFLSVGMMYLLWIFLFPSQPKPYQLTEAFCLVHMGFWEVCFMTGIVPVNNNYTRLFTRSSLAAQIVDYEGNVIHSTQNAVETTKEQKREAIKDGVLIEDNLKLNAHEIFGGYFFWTSDITNINQLNEALKDQMDLLEGENQMLSAEISLKHRQMAAEAKNAIYDTIAKNLNEKLTALEHNLQRVLKKEPENKVKMAIFCIVLTYVKRYSNLTLMGEMNNVIPLEELEYSIRESLEYVNLSGVAAQYTICGKGDFFLDRMLEALNQYDNFLESIYVDYREKAISGKLLVEINCDGYMLKIDFKFENQEDIREKSFSCPTIRYFGKEESYDEFY